MIGKGTVVGIRTMGFVVFLDGAQEGGPTWFAVGLTAKPAHCWHVPAFVLRLYPRGLGGSAFRVAAALAYPWRESVSDSPALCSPSAEACGAEKASKAKLRSRLRQLAFPVFYLGE